MMVGLPDISEWTTCGRKSYLWHILTSPWPVRNCERLHTEAANDARGVPLSTSGCSGSLGWCSPVPGSQEEKSGSQLKLMAGERPMVSSVDLGERMLTSSCSSSRIIAGREKWL